MKAVIKTAVVLIILFSLVQISLALVPRKIQIGESFEDGTARFTITDIQMASASYGTAMNCTDNFLTLASSNNLEQQGCLVQLEEDTAAPITLTMLIENTGKFDYTFYPALFNIHYADGNLYDSHFCYVHNSSSPYWTALDQIQIGKDSSDPVEVRIVIWVPKEILRGTAPLKLVYHNYLYQIR